LRLFDDHIRRLDLDNLEPSCSISAMSQGISDAVAAAVMLQTRRTKLRVPWWHPDLERISNKVKRAKHHIRDTPNPSAEARALFHSLDKQSRCMVARARDDFNARRLAKTDHRSVWRTIKHHHAHRRPIPPIDGAEDFQEKCNAFRNALFPPADTPPEVLPPDFVSSKADLRDEFHAVSRAKVDRVIARLNYGSAVGPDKISYKAVHRFHACLPHVLPRTFTDLFASAIHPTEWKDAHCLVIPKPVKRTYQTASAYRPISLLSCFGKVFEAIAARQLSKAAAACEPISNAQMGARAQHSALDALLRVVDPIAYSLSQMHGILHSYPPRSGLLAHDIAGAFNNTHPVLLDQVLEQRCMPTNLRKWTRCHEPPGAFSSSQPGGQQGPISFSGPLLPRPCLRIGHLHLGLGLRPRCWYILVLARTPLYSITTDHSLPDSARTSLRLDYAPPRFVTISINTRWYSGSW
jgi:hypothetical protein